MGHALPVLHSLNDGIEKDELCQKWTHRFHLALVCEIKYYPVQKTFTVVMFVKLSETGFFFFTAISGEMKRVQLKIHEEKEKEKKIYAKMFA